MKILTLNLYRYYENWEKRKNLIVKYIQEQNPGIIFLQECFDDARYNTPKNNQAIQLNKKLNYKECVYDIAEKLCTEREKPITASVFDGLGCLSRFEIIEKNKISLKKSKDDKHFRIIQRFLFKINKKKFLFYHTHYSNRDGWAREHLKETIQLANKEKLQPIIVGDLNIRLTEDIQKFTKSKYLNSWEIKDYISYPSEEEVLDYVLIPKTMKFINILCDKDGLSDHRPLVVEINESILKTNRNLKNGDLNS
ncbi:MAG: endonuclease/exonuclease/phosphatase family protein [Nanoarchaeota archaeon]|nr:endonuclease/exonuclease/phosphatase family protein [Nanoarchaeota archaeon]